MVRYNTCKVIIEVTGRTATEPLDREGLDELRPVGQHGNMSREMKSTMGGENNGCRVLGGEGHIRNIEETTYLVSCPTVD